MIFELWYYDIWYLKLHSMNCRRIERLLRVQIKEQSYTTVISSQIKVHGHWTFFPQPKSCKCILQSLWYLPAFFFLCLTCTMMKSTRTYLCIRLIDVFSNSGSVTLYANIPLHLLVVIGIWRRDNLQYMNLCHSFK